MPGLCYFFGIKSKLWSPAMLLKEILLIPRVDFVLQYVFAFYIPSFKMFITNVNLKQMGFVFAIDCALSRRCEHFPSQKDRLLLSQGLAWYFLSETLPCLAIYLFYLYISFEFGTQSFRCFTWKKEHFYLQRSDMPEHFLLQLTLPPSMCSCPPTGKAMQSSFCWAKNSAKETFVIGLAINFPWIHHTKENLYFYSIKSTFQS